jgi:hypothetical protein
MISQVTSFYKVSFPTFYMQILFHPCMLHIQFILTSFYSLPLCYLVKNTNHEVPQYEAFFIPQSDFLISRYSSAFFMIATDTHLLEWETKIYIQTKQQLKL